MTDLRKAFLHWVAERPDANRKCCEGPHYSLPGWEPLPDSLVCDREKAWRAYVRIRDLHHDYPFRRRGAKPVTTQLGR
jgi:hypothetical protein